MLFSHKCSVQQKNKYTLLYRHTLHQMNHIQFENLYCP